MLSAKMQQQQQQPPHALMFPYPVQGHINPMMQLAKNMADRGFYVTFVNTDQNHERMFGKGSTAVVGETMPNVHFEHIPDGMPKRPDHVNVTGILVEMTTAILALSGPLANLVRRIMNTEECPPVTCIVSDAFCSWVQDVADIFNIPRVAFWTSPVHANLAYTFLSTLQSHGHIPVKDKSQLQETVECINGIAPMRLDDYISFYLIDDPSSDFLFQWHLRLGMKRSEEAAFNLGNNFEALEYEACRAFKEFVPNFLPIGPLLSVDILQCKPHMEAPAGISLMVEDATCNEWLSKHEKASVVYVSFGSMVNMPEEEVANIILGLEMIGAPFLWVARPDQSSAALSRFRESPSHQVLVVSWAPQIAVLTHPSVGLFISHCGWNSFLESMAGGVPILAKPGAFAEQRMNAHYIEEVWKVGHRLPDPVSACAVKSLVSSLLGSSTEAADMKRRMLKIKESARDALTPEGSSITNFDIFVNDMYRRAGMTYS